MLHILKGQLHEVESQDGEKTRKERREYKYFNSSDVMLVLLYLKSIQPVTITDKKSTGGFRVDYAIYT